MQVCKCASMEVCRWRLAHFLTLPHQPVNTLPQSDMQYSLQKAANVLLIIVLSFVILIYAKAFFIPIFFAVVLAMLMMPLTRKLEQKGVNKALSTLASIVTVLLVVTALVLFIRWQLVPIITDAEKMEKEVLGRLDDFRHYVANEFGITMKKQQQMIQEQTDAASGTAGDILVTTLGGLISLVTNFLLVMVYMFLLIYFRGQVKTFFLRMVNEQRRKATEKILHDSQQVAQKYLGGMSLMILSLWIMYGIGFTIAGVNNAIFFAILCGLLEIVPFVGNLTGTTLTVLMALAQGGSTAMIVGILVTYSVVQFIQSYILEPLVVGAGVRINPLFTIVALVAGEFVWGIPGMILALPVVGILKVVVDNINNLEPIGELIGEKEKSKA